MEQGIPALTPEEMAMVRQAEHANDLSMPFVTRYIHWSKARAGMLDTTGKEPKQLALVKGQINEAGRPGMHLPMEKILDSEEGTNEC